MLAAPARAVWVSRAPGRAFSTRPPSPWAWGLALAAIVPAAGILYGLGAAGPRKGVTSPVTLAWFVLFAPLIEEIIFRGGLQEWLLRQARAGGPLSPANGLASLAFAAAHLWAHSLGWALAVIAPSLVFGWFYEHGRRLWRPVLLHMIYNAVFFGVLAGS